VPSLSSAEKKKKKGGGGKKKKEEEGSEPRKARVFPAASRSTRIRINLTNGRRKKKMPEIAGDVEVAPNRQKPASTTLYYHL